MRTLLFSNALILLFSCSNKPSIKKENPKNPIQIKIASENVEYSKNAMAAENWRRSFAPFFWSLLHLLLISNLPILNYVNHAFTEFLFIATLQ
jgi:hypothetical protein